MCEEYAGRVVAITGFKNEDIKDYQYLQFLKVAKKYDCKVHCLGMTRTKILDKVPFDYADSSTWLQQVVYGNIFFPDKSTPKRFPKPKNSQDRKKQLRYNYKRGILMQEFYYNKWKGVNNLE